MFKGQKSSNVDYVSNDKKSTLAKETANNETTWSRGQRVSADMIAKAFGVDKLKDRSKVAPLSGSGFSWGTIFIVVLILLFFLPFLRACMGPGSNCDPRTDPNCSYSRSSSGSYGGYTSGGSHK